jgi:hypothetical protein
MVPNPRHLAAAQARLRALGRALSRKQGPDRRTGRRPSNRWRHASPERGGAADADVVHRRVTAGDRAGAQTAWSVALVLPRLRTRAWQCHVIGGATVLFGVGETAIMAIQAWRGVPSHYNFSTPFDGALAICGAALVIVYARLVAALVSHR